MIQCMYHFFPKHSFYFIDFLKIKIIFHRKDQPKSECIVLQTKIRIHQFLLICKKISFLKGYINTFLLSSILVVVSIVYFCMQNSLLCLHSLQKEKECIKSNTPNNYGHVNETHIRLRRSRQRTHGDHSYVCSFQTRTCKQTKRSLVQCR